MQVDAALIRERGVEFAVVIVKSTALRGSSREAVARQLSRFWGDVPVVLMAQDGQGVPTYFGRSDLVKFIRNVPLASMPWRRWTVH